MLSYSAQPLLMAEDMAEVDALGTLVNSKNEYVGVMSSLPLLVTVLEMETQQPGFVVVGSAFVVVGAALAAVELGSSEDVDVVASDTLEGVGSGISCRRPSGVNH